MIKPILASGPVRMTLDYTKPTPAEVLVTLTRLDDRRQVIVGRLTDPMPGEKPYIASLLWVEHDDHVDAQDEAWHRVGATTPTARVLSVIMGSADVEPELNLALVSSEGGTVIVIDLGQHWPGWKLHVPAGIVG